MGAGPPVTLSGTGSDKILYVQGHAVRDTTYFTEGGLLGARDIFTVEHGTGIGSCYPFFNRHMASMTRFIPLHQIYGGWLFNRLAYITPPSSLVVNGKVGNCIGDIAFYDYHALGGPHS